MEKVKEGRCATQAWKRSIILWAETFFYTFTLLLCTKTSEAVKHNYFDKGKATSIYVSNTKNTMNIGLQYRSAVCKSVSVAGLPCFAQSLWLGDVRLVIAIVIVINTKRSAHLWMVDF